ncbi:MAG: ligase-associated DNA damage response DEXH box helicase [Gammaproteobacteria bacterium]
MADAGPDRAAAWFAALGWEVFGFQRRAWEAYREGRSGLIHSPTGSGKTLAAWLGPLTEPGQGPGLKVLWITPLRALARDTARSLAAAAEAVDADWRVELRTGDTPQSARTRQRRRPPDALVTTPESLSVMLSYADADNLLGGLRCVVVDEWHELLGSKRGVQLQLCLARLRRLAPRMVTWGLSATLGNLEQAMAVLLGPERPGELIRGAVPRDIRIRALVPPEVERFPWSGHLGTRLLPRVVQALESGGTTLFFTNTRSQAELWHEALCAARPDWRDSIALHHGSVDRAGREGIEAAIAAGGLRCVVCTSSLDLGVDFSPVEQVIQVGSPKGVARLMQRAGRSGHRPGVPSEVLCVPTHAFELVEIAAARRAREAGRIEARTPPVLCLDVLAQHLVTLAVGGGFTEAEALEEARATHAFAALTDSAWGWVMDFVTRGGEALSAYPQFRKVVREGDRWTVADRNIARRHRMAIGTIASDAAMTVRWSSRNGGRLGTVEESFIARMKPGDRFLFSGRLLELVRVREMTAWVKAARRGGRTVPRWQGGRMPLSTELADTVVELLADPAGAAGPEMAAVRGLIEVQSRWSRLPSPDELLAERVRTREGHHLFLYPFAGRLVHEGLATLLAWRLSRRQPATFTLSFNDYGLELLSPDPFADDAGNLPAALDPGNLADDLAACVNVSEIARRQFRDIARIAGLVFPGYPGSGKTARQVQASSGLIFDVLVRYDAGNLLLDQARREVLEGQLEFRRLRQTLQEAGKRRLVVVDTPRLTPLAFPLWAERLQSQVISTEDWRTRVRRAAERLEKAAGRGKSDDHAADRLAG